MADPAKEVAETARLAGQAVEFGRKDAVALGTTMRKVMRRFVPVLFVSCLVALLDRINVGFAALTMNNDLGLSSTAFGFGAGLFFLTYIMFEVPSNLALERFGARLGVARRRDRFRSR